MFMATFEKCQEPLLEVEFCCNFYLSDQQITGLMPVQLEYGQLKVTQQ